MTEPTLRILGVYHPEVSEETWQEQFNVTGDEEETKDHFAKLVLIEAVVENLHEPFEMIEVGQFLPEYPDDKSRMQVGYDEGLLSPDGEELISRQMDCVKGNGPLRFAVYLHFYDPERPLRWQRGEVTCPPISSLPVRLQKLMPYTAAD